MPTGVTVGATGWMSQQREEANRSVAESLAELSPEELDEFMAGLSPEQALRLQYDWSVWARPKQKMPRVARNGLPWYVWLLLSGRGFGKSRVGSETVREWVGDVNAPPIRIALIAETAADARDVIVEGDSGLLSVCPPWNRPLYEPSKRRLTWPNGSIGILFSGEDPDQLRGPQFHKAWSDELAKYQYAQETWDNLEFALRLGARPQAVVTTTPRPIPIIKGMLEDEQTVVTVGSTYENLSNLAPTYIRRVLSKYEGTRLGRQELHAEVLTDVPGALWSYDLLEATRVKTIPPMKRIVVGVDPAISSNEGSDETGIVVCGKGVDDHYYVLRDVSGVYSPDEWGTKAVKMYKEFGADRLVAEKNQGGEMVERVIRTVDGNVSYKGVWASKGKITRAEPIAALYEQGRAHHFGAYGKLEDQMTSYAVDGFQGGTGSPDRMDAMVWAMTELSGGYVDNYDPSVWTPFKR